MIELLRRPGAFIHDIATKRVMKRFVERFRFVYFGRVDPRSAEHQLVRGLTVSADHVDNHYAVGAFRGHDITLVERYARLRYPGKADQDYRWIIMQVDLKRQGLPHFFVDGHHHEEVFFANMFVKFGNFENANRLFLLHDRMFLRYFKVFAPPDFFDEVADVLRPEVTAMLGHHFRQFDYEIDDDRLLVYASNAAMTPRLLPEMMRVGLWLADHINAQHMAGPVVDKE